MKIAFTIFLVMFASEAALAQDAAGSPYMLQQGTIGGLPVTILMEKSTGKTWYLGEIDSTGKLYTIAPLAVPATPTWIPLQFLTNSAKPATP